MDAAIRREGSSPGVSEDVLASVGMPERLESPFGSLEFFDGLPLPDTVRRSYDALDLMRGVEVFLNCMPGASMVAMRNGFRSIGQTASNVLAYTDPLATSANVVLTANTETTYGTNYLDLKTDGPTVIEAPPNALGFVDDIWQRYVTDIGLAGPDKGQGGKYLILPPDHDGDVPDGYFVARSPTYSNWLVIRALGGVQDLMTTRIYPLAQAGDPPATEFLNFSQASFNGVHGNDFSFFEEVASIVADEPAEALDPERAGQLAAIGIVARQAVRARRADALDPRRGGADRGRHRAQPGVRAARPRRLLLSPTAHGRQRSSAAATSSWPTAPGCSTPAR